MKAAVVSQPGGTEVLEVKNVPTPAVRPGWSLVKVKGFGVNHSEIFTCRGLSPSVKFPRILGIECVGIIARSTDAENLPEGTRVVSIMGEMGRAFDGSCRHPETKKDPLLQAGFNAVITDTANHLQTDVIFDRALDLIGPAALKDTCAHMAPGSIVCSTGQLGGKWFMDDFDPIEDLPANGYLTSFYSGNVTADRMRRMIDFITAHHVDTTPERVFDLDHVADAHRYLESRHSFGKVVVLP